jgi:hypothetical protein
MPAVTRPLRAAATLLAAVGSIAVAACAAGPPPAKAPAAEVPAGQYAMSAPQAPAVGIDGAVADLARAEDEMQRALAVAGGAPVSAPEQAPAQKPSPERAEPGASPSPPPRVTNGPSKAPSKHAEEERADALSASDACSVACRALESMRRSTEQLCGLAGAGDARCVDANARVGRALARVRASCPACAR